MKTRPRTKKVFKDYNDYTDRPFGLKWGTAFALDELMKVVDKNQLNALLEVVEKPEMSRDEIDKVLQIALLKSRHIRVQTSHRDDHDRLLPDIEGEFYGGADEEFLYVDDLEIAWEIIRNVELV